MFNDANVTRARVPRTNSRAQITRVLAIGGCLCRMQRRAGPILSVCYTTTLRLLS